MFFTVYFLFILVMTHALMALPFSGPGYYGHKFLKFGKSRPVYENVPKSILMYPKIVPVIFPKKMIPKVATKGFSHDSAMWNIPPLSTYWTPLSSVGPSTHGTFSKGEPFFDNLPKGKPQFDQSASNGELYSFWKSLNNPFTSMSQKPVMKYPGNSKGIPNIFEISFTNSKPKILFLKGTSSPYVQQNEFKPTEVGFNNQFQPKPNSDKTIVTIDIVNTDKEPPAKNIKPVEDVGYFDIVNLPVDSRTNIKDVPTNTVDIHIVDISKPNNGDNLIGNIPIKASVNTKVIEIPKPNVNTVFDVSPVDISVEGPDGEINKDLTIVPISPSDGVESSTEKLNTDSAITVGDIPGFIVDGKSSSDARSGTIYVTNEIPRNEPEIDVFNVNDVLTSGSANTDIISTNVGFGLNSNKNFAPSSFGVGDLNINGIANPDENSDKISIGVASESVIGGNTGNNGLSANAFAGIQNGKIDVKTIVTSVTQPTDSNVNDINLSNEMSGVTLSGNMDSSSTVPASITENKQTGGVSAPEEDTSNQGIGSVVVIRPVSFLMNVEPFGPGPYGQCRVPARVECGARFGWEHVTGMTEWCQSNCVVFMYSSYCDDDRCQCKCVSVHTAL